MTHRLLRQTLVCLLALLCLLAAGSVHADVFGRLRFTVHDTAGKPVQGANIIFHDTAGVNPDFNVISDAAGAALSPPLEIRPWRITTRIVTFNTDTRTVSVTADTSTEVDILLTKRVVSTTSNVTVPRNQPTESTRRGQQFIQSIPSTRSNPQNFPRLLLTVPGFVESSNNVVHPRGEHASTTIYVDGFQLPGALQGRAGPLISPDIIQSADIQTGGFSPEYGSETAAIINLSLRAGPIKPIQEVQFGAGGYKTLDQELSFGGQAGAEPGRSGPFKYFFNIINRSTDNSIEPPQPDHQDVHNHGRALTAFGNLQYQAGRNDQFSLLLNTAPAQTQVANRYGLPDKYAPVGQGFGYGGARDADGTSAGVPPSADPTQNLLGQAQEILPSQQDAHQDVYQNDENRFGDLNYRHSFGNALTGLLSLGSSSTRLDIRNNNPAINLGSVDPATGYLTTIDNSIEYNPTIQRKSSQTELAGSLTKTAGTHTYKAGLLLTRQSGDELYNIIPQSQLALDAEAANAPTLAPAGSFQVDGSGSPVMDVLGDQIYTITPGASAPVVSVHRSGYYNAGYLQDTWRATRQITLNYGARYDSYYGKQSLSPDSVKKNYLSPRINFAYAFTPQTTVRLSYNKLFSQPPLAQGAILGTNLVPQTTDLYDTSIQQQITPQQSVKFSYYYKNARNEFDTGLLIPYTQFGAYTTLQYTSQGVHGYEFSYDFVPRGRVGLNGYFAYTNSIARPNGLDQTGAPAPVVNDHDQLNTLSGGLSYTFASQAYAGLDVYYGSGEASSVLAPIGASNTNVINNGQRNSHSSVNIRLGHPHLFGPLGLELDVENLFNDLSVLNFNSGYSGTRFQEGRRAVLRVTGSF